MAPNLERMYECGDVLANAKGLSIQAHKDEYQEILDGVKGDDQCKRLASQFIARFFSHFPDLVDKAIDAMLDLCEDPAVDIRKQAIKDLPTLCRDNKANLPKITDVLTQLLTSDDTGEITVIQNSIMSLLRKDPAGAIIGLFSQIHTGEDVVRERALRLLHTKIKTGGGADLLTKEAQAQLVAEIKKMFASEEHGVTADEFPRLLAILEYTSLPKTVSGQLEIANMIMGMAELDKSVDFDYTSVELTDRLIQCAQHALPYFSTQVKSTPFCEYLCLRVLPHYYQLPDLPGIDTKSTLVKTLAELSVSIGGLEDPATCAANVFERLIDYMPLPPVEEDGSLAEVPALEFTKVECLMFTFHTICKQADKFLTEDQERLKDFRVRLQFLARGVTGYLKKLKEFLSSPAGRKTEEEDVKIKQIALRSTENLQAMIRDLFHSPPIFKATIVLSWKPRDARGKVPLKRKLISAGGDEPKIKSGTVLAGATAAAAVKKAKPITKALYMDTLERKIGATKIGGKSGVSAYKPPPRVTARPTGLYQPPTGQYSSKIQGGRTPITWD